MKTQGRFGVTSQPLTTDDLEKDEIKQDVMLRIIQIVHSHEADFAFPTTTIDGVENLISRAGN